MKKIVASLSGLKSSLRGLLIIFVLVSTLACTNYPGGKVLVVYVNSTPYLAEKGYNKYYYSEYPANDFFVYAYLTGFTSTLNEARTSTGLEVSMLTNMDVTALKSALSERSDLLHSMDADNDNMHYSYLTNDVLAFRGFSAGEQNALIKVMAAELGDKYEYFAAIDLTYSVVDQRVVKKIKLFNRKGVKIFTSKKKLLSKYILYDKTSAYLIADSYFNKNPTERTVMAELEHMASELGAAVGEKVVKKLSKSFQAQ
ncbi:hypothetical protein COTS27_00681 [Spirochaetota bacterium]|nr:hypothetical protein COTS27_00681 [Spirochaetota bacterium]